MPSRKATCTIYNEDCVQGLQNRTGASSVDLTVTSIPFEELFLRIPALSKT
jgi:hypothetical protein